MLGVLRLLLLWRAIRLLAPLVVCGLLAVLLTDRPSSPARAAGARQLELVRSEVRRALAPEIARARRTVTSALTAGKR